MRARALRGASTRLHRLLGLGQDEPYARVRTSYLQAVRKCHPDVCKSDCNQFLAVQAAWEEYEGSSRERKEEERMAKAPWTPNRSTTMEMVLLGLQIKGAAQPWDDAERESTVHQLRTAVMRAITGLSDELPPVDVRRVEINDDGRADLHIHAVEGPKHREAVVRMTSASPDAFTHRLLNALDAAGWPTSMSSVALRVCLPYTIAAAPPPRVPQHCE